MGLECVSSDHRAGEVGPVQQRGEGGDLLGRAADLALGQHRPGGVVQDLWFLVWGLLFALAAWRYGRESSSRGPR